ncbi:alpha/beta fold hydrolase [Ahrensia sp. 13_GOM-1096m]|uniref:alpha/beta fold hydrolase n=1 Tax=Ahrensia sp. 13_GOM-1096m TaxID=1380380 RepID=UPI00047A2184|nr:alpha/beta hydrolase [Ahrensia sp. 13_GOM-1096m]
MFMNNIAEPIMHLDEEDQPTVSLIHRKAGSKHGLDYWLFLPKSVDSYHTPVVALHGIKRRARVQVEMYASYAQTLGRPVIAPVFSKETWPCYQQVVRKGRADLAFFGLLNELRTAGIWQTDKIDLAGFSGGAQFAHRFAMLYPEAVGRLIVSSSGWYTFPDSRPFPYGFGARSGPHNWGPLLENTLAQFLKIPITVTVGEHDCKKDTNTRSGQAIDAQQGAHRLERARRWIDALHRAAEARNLLPPDVALHVLPNCGHGFVECVKRGGLADLVFSSGSKSVSVAKTNATAASSKFVQTLEN